jgi:hypothetical protein
MSEDGAKRADGAEAAATARTWTNVYVQFSLPRHDQQTLEDLLFERGSSLGEEFRRALEARLLEGGIDPAALERPELDDDHDH